MTSNADPIYVTQPNLPPLEEFIPYLEQIWASGRLTNNGPLHQQLEQALCDYLDVPFVSLFCNGTIALMTGLKALEIEGEVITTPFSFPATAHALVWNNLTPVFVDIDPSTANLDPNRIEDAITSRTSAILPVHCYGNPCDVDAIETIATSHGLKVIYDAAHAFGVRCHCGSILNHGDLSVLSFHATKVFNTFEGGAIVCDDKLTKQYVDRLKNFGFVDETTVVASGINGKMNELQAAMGLLQLKGIDTAIGRRADIASRYREELRGVPGITCLPEAGQARANYSYFPILINEDYPLSRDELYDSLNQHGVYARRYFYPLLTDFPMYNRLMADTKHSFSGAYALTHKVICLPIYPALDDQTVIEVTDVIKDAA